MNSIQRWNAPDPGCRDYNIQLQDGVSSLKIVQYETVVGALCRRTIPANRGELIGAGCTPGGEEYELH